LGTSWKPKEAVSSLMLADHSGGAGAGLYRRHAIT
jgi:hypothetical protein